METAKLFHDIVNIEQERQELQAEGYSWDKIRDVLDEKYRKHAQKGKFICRCCGSTVKLVLYGPEKVCFFSHKNTDECSGKDNYKKYTSSRIGENDQQHRIGKTILKEYLTGQLKFRGIEVQDGYLYKQRLNIIPDLILYFPDGQVWAIDYITGTKTDQNYHNFLRKRIQTYADQGFRSFFLIDEEWYSPHMEKPVLSLYRSEFLMLRSTEYDQIWKEKIESIVRLYGENSLIVLQSSETIRPYTVLTMMYVNMSKLTALMVRCVPIISRSDSTVGWAYMPHEAVPLQLDQIVTLNDRGTDFRWFAPNELSMRDELKQRAQNAYEELNAKLERERMEKEEEAKRLNEQAEKAAREYKQRQEAKTRVQQVYRDEVAAAYDVKQDAQSSSQIRADAFGKVEYYRFLLARFRLSEYLKAYPVFHEHIERCQSIIDQADRDGEISREAWSSLYSQMENMKNALKVE
ncbi:hypothetical protein [Paenibacillus periandrae]|uniref:hypothetical protein n=1 Tax=Paenibacillus periandrae TaxID=1761741 RepID=UPI001F089ED4|nr:hypothetical protein [Paenibacillus periandrae]